jgi:hypothetical protein
MYYLAIQGERLMKKVVISALLLLPLCGCATTQLAYTTGASQVVKMTLRNQPDIMDETGFGACQCLYPHDKPEEDITTPPGIFAHPIYFSAKYGNARDNIHTIVVDDDESNMRCLADVNNDNKFSDKELITLTRDDGPDKARTARIGLKIKVDGKRVPYYFTFLAFKYSEEEAAAAGNTSIDKCTMGNARNGSYRLGEVIIDGQKMKIAVADINSNGIFNDLEEDLFKGDRFFLHEGDDYRLTEDSYPYGGYTFLKGNWYAVESNGAGTRMKVTRANPPCGTLKGLPAGAQLELRSKTQPLVVNFADTGAEAVAGLYKIGQICMPTGEGSHMMRGTWKNRTMLRIYEGSTKQLQAGPPYTLTINLENGGEVEQGVPVFGIKPVIIGAGEEQYLVPQSKEAAIVIKDAEGKTVHEEQLKPG